MKRKILSLTLAFFLTTALLPSQTAVAAVTTAVPGDTYYFDLSSQEIPGTVNSDLSDGSLHWVPFTYVGEISAYSRKTIGVSTAADVSVSDRMLFIADYNVTTSVSWDTLNSKGLIFGKDYSAYGAEYELRAPSVGSGSHSSYSSSPDINEWDEIYKADNGYIKNYDSIASWGQDSFVYASDPSEIVVIRGGTAGADYHQPAPNTTVMSSIGFRPVLQADTADLQVITLFLNGGSILNGQETLQIVINADADWYAAPVSDGIVRPEGDEGSYFRWNTQADGTGDNYLPGENVPASVTTLYANWAPVEQYSLAVGETYYFDLSKETFPGTITVKRVYSGFGEYPGLPDPTLHYVPFTYIGTIEGYSIESSQAVTEEWAAQNQSARSLFLSDYCVTHTVSWNALDQLNLIFGKDFQSNLLSYRLRALSVGTGRVGIPISNELDRILEKNPDLLYDDLLGFWGQDSAANWPDNRVDRGKKALGNLSPDASWFITGYRPALQVQSSAEPDLMAAVTVNLGGGTIDTVTGSIKLVVKSGSSFTAPSGIGITRPAEGEYFMWKGSDNQLYAPGASVPAGVTGLTAVFESEATEPDTPPAITTASLPSGTVNKHYSQKLAATGDEPITWSIESGSLPSGLSLTGDTISGAPKAAGTFTFAVKAENSTGSDTKTLSININNVPSHTHSLAYKYTDGTGHWQECSDASCPDEDKGKTATEAHSYGDDADTSCDTCGYTRTVEIGGGDNDDGDDDDPAITPSTSVTVPVSSGENSIQVNAEISGTTAILDDTKLSSFDTVLDDYVDDVDAITLDLSTLNRKIDAVVLSDELIEKIRNVVSGSNVRSEILKVIFSDGSSIGFDAEALRGMYEWANALNITISFKCIEDSLVNSRQQQTIGNRLAFDININRGVMRNSYIGGNMTMATPYELNSGENAEGIKVFYVDDNGNKEPCDTSYDSMKKKVKWETDHLSVYMIGYEQPQINSETGDDTPAGEIHQNPDGEDKTSTTPAYVTYAVKCGDTLWAISRKYGCTISEIVAANSDLIKNPNLIYAGWQLKIPQGVSMNTDTTSDAILPGDEKTAIYIVKRGDTLWEISKKYGCTIAEIVDLNGELITDPDLIFAGWELKIPCKCSEK